MQSGILDGPRPHSALPSRGAALAFAAKAAVLRTRRTVRDAWSREATRFSPVPPRPGDVLVAESAGALGLHGPAAEHALTLGKIHNLRLAARRLDGVMIPAGQVFSFWAHVGRATRRAGYVEGRELREGCVIPAIGGGLCQLSNALYDAALNAGFEIVERHAHTAVVAGSLAERGRDATVFWNYVDLRFRPSRDVRIAIDLGRDELRVRFTGAPVRATIDLVAIHVSADTSTARRAAHDTGDCATCGEGDCFRNAPAVAHARDFASSDTRAAYVLDGVWPEYDIHVALSSNPGDVAFVPMDGARRHRPRYAWTLDAFETLVEGRTLAIARAAALRFAASQGAARQRAAIEWSARLANAFAKRIPFDVGHVVVMQHLLPALWRSGALGGRSFDVLMTGMPMRDLQRTLDVAAATHPESNTLADFRIDETALAEEDAALSAARHIVTPHAAVATRFGERAVHLPWSLPGRSRTLGMRDARSIVFPASTLGRKGAYAVRAVARELDLRVVHPGNELEGADFWQGVETTRWTSFAASLLSARAVVLPAYVEDQPRLLLRAAAAGVPVVASRECGLGAMPGVTEIAAGDERALAAALA